MYALSSINQAFKWTSDPSNHVISQLTNGKTSRNEIIGNKITNLMAENAMDSNELIALVPRDRVKW